jgi:hypothetical protein
LAPLARASTEIAGIWFTWFKLAANKAKAMFYAVAR